MASTQELLLGEGAGGGGPANYIEDVFSTYLYTGTGAAQTITNNIDLSTKGGMMWNKCRSSAVVHRLWDTSRGMTYTNAYYLDSDATDASTSAGANYLKANTDGFSWGSGATGSAVNSSGNTYVSWTFRKQPKFFDVVTYTGNGSTQNIAHNLGSAPGCIIVKCTSNAGQDWFVYHRTQGNGYGLLNTTGSWGTYTGYWNNTAPTSTQFSVGTSNGVNGNGYTYVAYLFAHNAGGFGLTGTDNVISCASFTNDASSNATVNLGYEPQWIMFKNANAAGDWVMVDNMRGWSQTGDKSFYANSSAAEATLTSSNDFVITPTGFQMTGYGASSQTYIYIAIRRGPMKVPTDATKVFSPVANTQSSGTVRTIGFPADLAISSGRTTNLVRMFNDRLRGFSSTNTAFGPRLFSNDTAAESSSYTGVGAVTNTGYQDGDYFDPGISMIRYLLGRAPGFFDEVCYTGTGANQQVTHNLTVAPELVIVKRRSNVANWVVRVPSSTNAYYLNTTDSPGYASWWDAGANTSTYFTTKTASNAYVNDSGSTFVAYLFATCAGVSKVGSYTGTGTLTTINCGFTGGARFVLIKRTDSTSNWFVWDTARGMVAGTDPSFAINSTTAEANANSVYTATTGFQLLASPSADVNTNGGTYIYLAIA